MHELSLSAAILAAAERYAGGRRVVAIDLWVGHMRRVMPAALEFYFGVVARGTVCEGARLDQTVVAARAHCRSCHEEWSVEGPFFRCPWCREAAIELLSGNELRVESITVDEYLEVGSPDPVVCREVAESDHELRERIENVP